MNTLGIALLWCVVQVTLVGLLAAGIYVFARRFWAAAAVPIVLAGLAMVVTLSLLALSPWPRWVTHDSAVSVTPIAAADAEARGASRVEVIESALNQNAPREQGQTENSRLSGSALFWRALVDEFSRPQPVVQAEIWRWPALVALVLLAAMLLGLGRLVLGLAVVRRERLGSRPVHDKRLLELADVLRAELGCRRSVELRECDRLATAATIGWRRPILLVPSDWTDWTADERRAVLAHELAHVRSRDCLSLLLGQFGLALHFYHPLIHWLAARLRLEQELAADAAAASVSGGSRAYLMTIARLALRQQDRSLPWPAGTFLPTRNTFLRRIAMLRDNKLTFRRLSPVVHATVLGLVLFGGLIAAGLRGPGWQNRAVAQPPAMATASTSAIPENHGSQIDLSVVPASCNMFIAMRPADAFARPELAPMAELFEAMNTCPKGTHAVDIRQITMILPGEIPTGPREIVVFQFLKPFAATSLIENVAPGMAGVTVKERNGKKMYCNDKHGVLLQYDERTLIAGSEKAMDIYLAGNPGVCPPWLPKETWDAFRADHVVLAYNMPALQRDAKAFVNYLSQRGLEPIKIMLSMVAPLWEDTTCVAAGLRLGQAVRIHGMTLAKDEKDAEAIEQTVDAVRTLALNAIREAVKTAREQGKEGNPFEQFAVPKLDQFLSALQIEREGTAVHAEGSIDMETVRNFLSMIIEARKSASRMVSANNLKEIALALLNYEAMHGHFPPAVLYGPDGKTPYSWRVAILPYLEQQALYNMYHFDEPWDSPANRKVLETRVPVFCRSKEMTGSSTNTCYFALTGPGTMFDGENGTRIAEIGDGTTNTILLVEAKRDVPWTKPEDIPYAADKPLPKLGRFDDGQFNVVFTDGHVSSLLEDTPEKLFRALITKNGGEPIDAKNPVVRPGPQPNQVWGPDRSELGPIQQR